MQASAADSFLVPALTLGVLGTLGWLGRNAGPSRSGVAPSGPTIVEQSPPENKKDAPPARAAEARLSNKRRKYVLDGDGKGGGGHGPGRNTPDKSSFPADWSDEKTVEVILDVANDPNSKRYSSGSGRTVVEGTRDGVDITVIVIGDAKAIISAYLTNMPINKGK